MGLENLKSVFQEDLINNIESFSSNVITNVNDTKLTQFTTPELSKLIGQSPLDGKSWETLYNSNHSPKDDVGYNYPNASRDNLNIKSQQDGRFGVATTRSSLIGTVGKLLGEAGLSGGFQKFLQDTGKEPYIVSKIGNGGRTINSNITEGGIPIERMLTDTARIAKYLTSPAGVAFALKQNFLGENTKSIFLSRDGELMQSSQRFKDTYNPLSTLLQTFGRAGFGPAGLVDKTEPGLSSLFGSDEYGNSNFIGGNVPYDVNKTFTDGGPGTGPFSFSKFGKQLLNTIKGAAGAPTPAKKWSAEGDKMTLAKIIKGTELFTSAGSGMTGVKDDPIDISTWDKVDGDIDAEKDGMPFYFKDLRDKSYIFFRAYIEGISENISPSYASHNYVGRSEPVYTYERAEREISFTLKLVAQTSDELKAIYKKMDRLTSMCYPQYVDEGETGYGNRMKPPLAKLRYGELFGKTNKELMGYIKSISYSVEQTSPYEIKVGNRVPRHVTATIGYQVIHDKTPRLGTKFYGINK